MCSAAERVLATSGALPPTRQSGTIEAFVGLGREVVGDRLDPPFHGATLFAEPIIVSDQAAIAHSVDYGGGLFCWEVVGT